MGLRHWLFRLLDRGTVEVDPNELIEFALVRVAERPMLLSRLQTAGIDAVSDDAFNPATEALTDFRIMVPRRQFADAARVREQR